MKRISLIAVILISFGVSQSNAQFFKKLTERAMQKTEQLVIDKAASKVANKAADDAVQIHGANGYSNEYPVERYLRNSKAPVIYEGTREIHTIMQAEYVLGKRVDKELSNMLPAWK